jgi:hypothetical protein
MDEATQQLVNSYINTRKFADHMIEDQLDRAGVAPCANCGTWCRADDLDKDFFCGDCNHYGGE